MAVHFRSSCGSYNPQPFGAQEYRRSNLFQLFKEKHPQLYYSNLIKDYNFNFLNRVFNQINKPELDACYASYTLSVPSIYYLSRDYEQPCQKASEFLRDVQKREPLLHEKHDVLGLTVCHYSSKNPNEGICTKQRKALTVEEAIDVIDSHSITT